MLARRCFSQNFARLSQIAASLLLGHFAQAAEYTYTRSTNNTSGTADLWSAGTNWTATPIGASDTILTLTGTLAASGTAFTSNDIAGNFQLNRLNFTYAGPASGTIPNVTLSGNTLELVNDGATTPVLSIVPTGTVLPTLTINAPLSAASGFTKEGAGTLILAGANTGLGGALAVSAGTLRAAISSALGSSTVTVASGAKLQLVGVSLGNNINLNGTSALEVLTGAASLTGTVTLQSNSSILWQGNATSLTMDGNLNLGANQLTVTGTNAKPLILNGEISGTGTLALGSIGSSVTITRDNSATYSGQVNVTRTTLAVGNNGALGTGTIVFGVNDQPSGIRSTDTSARSIGNPLTFVGSANSTFVFGSTTASANGNLAFTNGNNAVLPNASTKFVVHNRAELSTTFTGGGGITMQTGTGTLVLAGTSTYSGPTAVNAGTLIVNGSISGSATAVNSGGTLGGIGTVKNLTVNAGGAIAPGEGIGTLNTLNGNFTWNGETSGAFAQMKFELSSAIGNTASDKLSLGTGVFTKGATGSVFLFDFLGSGAAGNTYTLLTFGSSSGFSESDFSYVNLGGGLTGTFSLAADSLQLTVIPEPGIGAILLAGCGMLIGSQRRRRQQRS